ncbi:methionyl-tRNA formyltransferase [Bacillus pakistanensis]|uniref:Methionyl-tRNA formyltransferase n=1 Tax=Rossellomorea pakistanensis TaxID=992288 RepID=A0ABS2NFZ1_9BACI|nr:methionyl-tRNA formyltransferase [Bacillus pakistanensis]MBM7586783.1 methionyl-tRNA formyltransferase [Bacillus pakistanensis]
MTKIIFMGTPDFSVPVLRNLVDAEYDIIAVVTQPDRPVGRKRILTPPPVKEEAVKHGIPVLQPEKVRQKDELAKILALNPDLIITAAYGQILPNELLESPKHGCINVHASLLPELRGGAPIHYSILQGKDETGVTIMYMVEKLDAGDIISQVAVPIEESDHVGTLHNKLSKAGAKLLLDTLPALLSGEIKAVKQNGEEATFASNIKREQEKIDWTQSGETIYNHIRGLHPWPVAYTLLDSSVMKVWWGEKVVTLKKGVPGEIIKIEEDGFVVATGNETCIKITDLQPSGKKRMSATDYLRGAGAHLTEGMKLGVKSNG